MIEANSTMAILPDEYRSTLVPGSRVPDAGAIATLFNDEYTEDAPEKDGLGSLFSGRLSRGLYEGIFDYSDYVFTFDQRSVLILERLRKLWGRESGKAKITLLGKYWPSPESGKDIYQLSASNLADPARAQLLLMRTIAGFKVCIKLWLNRDFGWTEPSPATTPPITQYPQAVLGVET